MTSNLSISLSAAVPLHIMKFIEKGGITKADMEEAVSFGAVLDKKAEVLLFGGKEKGECADLFNKMARSIAVLSFMPGGVCLFGHNWDANDYKKEKS